MLKTIKSCYVNDSDSKGNPFMTKNGNQYWRVSVTFSDDTKASQSFFNPSDPLFAIASSWKEGDHVEVDIEQNGEYTNFTPIPRKEDILDYILFIMGKINKLNLYKKRSFKSPNVDEEKIDVSDLPF